MPKPRMERTPYTLITEGVSKDEQTLSAGKPFWVFFVTNICIATWLTGVLIAGMGLDFADAMFVLLIGSVIGSAVPALMSTIGPRSRLSQIELGRYSLGRTGKKLPAILNWVAAIGWDVINNVLSASALVAFLAVFGVASPFWLALGILVAIQLVIGIYGHHLIQDTAKYTGIVLGAFFVVIGLIAMRKTGTAPVTGHTIPAKDIFSAITLVFAFNISWVTVASDYTRYLPRHTPGRSVFFSTFAALFLSLFVLAFFGYMTASSVTEQTPQGVMAALQGLTGRFAPLVLLLIAFNSIPSNALNDNSAAYCLISSGFKFSRPVAAVFGALAGYVVCLFASGSFVDFFENFLFLFAHWMAPWAAIILTHWYIVGKKEQATPSGITRGCVIFVAVSAASIALFSANSLYTGFLSDQIGGVDLGPYIGFIAAGSIYYATLRLWPGKYRAVKLAGN